MKHEFISVINNDRLQPSVTKKILKVIEGNNGKRFKITIEKFSAKRSLPQNNYIHLLFTIFTDALNELGNEFSSKQIKELCKTKYPFYIDVVDITTGEVIGQERKGTSDFTKEEMAIFIDKVIQWAAETFRIKLPYPNENFEFDFDKSDKMFNQFTNN
jgi:hypothetical protein